MSSSNARTRIRSRVPRPLWRAARSLYWSFLGNAVRRVGARATVIRRHRELSGIETFLLFIGYPRSGHSLVGSLVNAHRHAVVAHELHALWYYERRFSIREIVALILRRDRWFERRNRQWTEFNYTVPGQWQGRSERLTVVGDKKGDGVTDIVHRYPGLLRAFHARVEREIGARGRIVHTVRNPYDNIATMRRRTGDSLDYVIDRHEKRIALNAYLIETLPAEVVLTVRHEDLIATPRDVIAAIAGHLGLDAPPEYLDACVSILYEAPNRSRHSTDWSDSQRERIDAMIARTPFLAGYRFDE
jgi:hypothetical protein